MRESVIYQDILQEGLQEGMQTGLKQGLEQGLEQGKQQGEAALILRQLTRRLGTVAVPPELQERICGLSIAQLEDLAEALLDFSQPADLVSWLEVHQGS